MEAPSGFICRIAEPLSSDFNFNCQILDSVCRRPWRNPSNMSEIYKKLKKFGLVYVLLCQVKVQVDGGCQKRCLREGKIGYL
jgi:hypothetical protein